MDVLVWWVPRSGSVPPLLASGGLSLLVVLPPRSVRCGAGARSFLLLRCLESVMSVRRSALSFPLVPTSDPAWSHREWTGHGCGPIAPVAWLAARPELCERVSSWYVDNMLARHTWDRCSAAHELERIARAGGKLSRRARRHLAWWTRAGRPAPWRASGAGWDYDDIAALPVKVFARLGFVA